MAAFKGAAETGLRCENKAAIPHISVQRGLDREQLGLSQLQQGVTLRQSHQILSCVKWIWRGGFKRPGGRRAKSEGRRTEGRKKAEGRGLKSGNAEKRKAEGEPIIGNTFGFIVHTFFLSFALSEALGGGSGHESSASTSVELKGIDVEFLGR